MRRFACILSAAVLLVLASAVSVTAAVPTLTGGSPHLAGWTGPITVSVVADIGDDPSATYTVLWDGNAAAVEPSGSTGSCQTPAGQPTLTCHLTAPAKAGTHTLALRDDLASTTLTSSTITIRPHLKSRVVRVAPLRFTPFKRDRVADKVNVTFMINKAAKVRFQVRNKAGAIVRHAPGKSFV